MTPQGGGAAPHGGGPRWLAASQLPNSLRDLGRPPEGLWYLGDPGLLIGAPDRHVAIVGTRDASPYGERTAIRLALACVEAGLVIVSGLARGVDAAAHRAALEAGGGTIAFMGTGVDVPYPVGHRALHGEVGRRGLVLSEFEPGSRAGPGCFPQRNRLIAALCRVTVVIEAGFKSGAINTATQALELGRTVASVPGPIDSARSAGANLLCRDGAQVVTCVEDLLSLFELPTAGRSKAAGFATAATGVAPQGRECDASRAFGSSGPLWPRDEGELSVRQLSEQALRRELGEEVER